MNYLAHLYLADPEPESLLGNLMGDFVKGPLADSLSPGLRQGIVLHRKVDAFSDAHPVFGCSRRRIRSELRRYGGILVDVFYDHFLAVHWPHYAPVSLRLFSCSVYAILETHYHALPARMQRSVAYMLANDLLMSYRELEGIEQALCGIERRLRRPSGLSRGIVDLERHYGALETDFSAFFPELIAYAQRCKNYLS